jgi:Ca2+-transporting ATPase
MAAHDLGIPQITVLDIHGDTSSSPIYNSSFPTIGPPMRGDRSPPSDVHDTHPLLSLVLTNYPTHPDVPDSPPSLTSDASPSHPPPSPTQSAHSSVRITSAGSPDINAEEHDHLSSSGLLTPPTRVSSIGASRKINSSSSHRQLISVSPCHFGVLVTTPSPTNTHPDARSDTSLPSSVAGSYNGIVRCVRYPPSGDTTSSDIRRNDSVQKEENAGVRPDSAATDLNVDSFAFKPLLLSLIDPKSLENLEGSGGVEGLLHGFGTDRLHGPSTTKRLRQSGSPDPDPGIRGINNAITPPLDQIRKSRFERMSRWTLRYFCQCKRGRLMLHTPPPSRALAASPTAHVKVAEFNPSRINSPLIVYPFRQLELALMTTSPTVPTSPGGAFGVDRFVSLKAIIENRQRVYGHSIIPHRPSKRLVLLMWLALHAKVLVSQSYDIPPFSLDLICVSQALLSVAIISLTLRIFLDFRTTRPEGDPSVWTDGVAIVVAILVVVIVGSLNEWQKEKQSKARSKKNKDRLVTVIRDGRERQIHAHEIAVGDVVLFEPGEVIPCDGVFFSGHNVFCDESGATGESDAIKKLFDQECTALKDNRPMELDASGSPGDGESPSGLELLGHADCFIASGSNVLDGSYVVTSVGTKSFNGHIVMGPFIALPRGHSL